MRLSCNARRLSEFPLETEVPGLLGYFQVDAAGQLRTPIVPEANAANYGISSTELQQREQQAGRIRGILDRNRLVGKSDLARTPAVVGESLVEEEIAQQRNDSPSLATELYDFSSSIATADRDNQSQGQAGFDELTTRKLVMPAESRAAADQVKDLKLEDSYEVAASAAPEAQRLEAKKQTSAKRSRKEKVNLPQALSQPVQSLEKSAADDEAVSYGSNPRRYLNQQGSASRPSRAKSNRWNLPCSTVDISCCSGVSGTRTNVTCRVSCLNRPTSSSV